MPKDDESSRREAEQLASTLRRLADHLVETGLRSRSQWALEALVDTMEGDGLQGVAIIKIPPKASVSPEVIFSMMTDMQFSGRVE